MNAMAYAVLVLGLFAIGGIVIAAIWSVGKVLEGIIWMVGLVLRGVGWIVVMLIGWIIRGGRAVIQSVVERRYAAARRRRE